MTVKNKQFLGPYKQKELIATIPAPVTDADTNDTVEFKVPVADNYQISIGARTVTSTGAAVTEITADDTTITVSVDGGDTYVNAGLSASLTAVLQADLGGTVVLSGMFITHIRLAAAQLAADETQAHHIVCFNE